MQIRWTGDDIDYIKNNFDKSSYKQLVMYIGLNPVQGVILSRFIIGLRPKNAI